MTSETIDHEKVFAALADATRHQLLSAIAASGWATASSLTTKVTVSRQAVMKHLTVLHDAGLVSRHREGRELRYRVCPGRLQVTAKWLAAIAASWDDKLLSIKRLAEESDDNIE